MIQILKMSQNPMVEMQRMFSNTPVWGQYQQLTQGKNEQELEQVARNLAQTKGIDINQYRSQFGL